MSTFPNAAIVIELGINGLGVVRSLGRQGIDVIGVYTEPGPGMRSRFCRAVPFPKISEDEEGFKEQLVALCASLDAPPVLVSTSDEAVSFVSRHRDELRRHALFPLPASGVLEKFLNKDGTFELASQCGVPVPQTFTPHSLAEVEEIAERIHFPVIFKPNDTFSVRLPNREKNLTFRTGEEIRDFFRLYPGYAQGKGVLQEFIWGGDGHLFICAGYFDSAGEAVATYTGRKVRQYLPDYGIASFSESIHVPELERTTRSFMKQLRYHGFASAEYTRDRATGEFYLLEVNARTIYPNALFLSCGVNLPLAAYRDMTGLPQPPFVRQKEGVCWIDFPRDLASFLRKRKRGELGLGEWLSWVVKARSFGVFALDDLGPAAHEAMHMVRVAVRKLTGRS